MEPELSNFNFEVLVSFDSSAGASGLDLRAAFSEASGLEINVEAVELVEGGYNRGTRKLVGKATNPPIVLKRGLSVDRGFWEWIQASFRGEYPVPFASGEVRVFAPFPAPDGGPMARFRFVQGLATKVKAPDLNALGAAIPIEELHIAHEGLERIE